MHGKFIRDLDEIKEGEKVEWTRDDIFEPIEKIKIDGKYFILTGTFTSGKRSTIEKLIKENGGIVKPRFSSDIDYLIVGEITSNGWKHGNYGTKIEKALDMKKKGYAIKIIHEQTLMRSLSDKVQDQNEEDSKLIKMFLSVEPIDHRIEINQYGEEKIVYLDDIVYDYLSTMKKSLQTRVKYFHERIREIRYFYEKLSNEERGKINKELPRLLRNYIHKSLVYNLKDIANHINSAQQIETKKRRLERSIDELYKMFGDFSKLSDFESKVQEFIKEQNTLIDK